MGFVFGVWLAGALSASLRSETAVKHRSALECLGYKNLKITKTSLPKSQKVSRFKVLTLKIPSRNCTFKPQLFSDTVQ